MNALTSEWVAKAEMDYEGAVSLNRKRKHPLPDLVCFHCQQCLEKYLKGFLHESKISFPKTHSLIDLLNLAVAKVPSLNSLQPDLLFVDNFAVKFRYPGMEATAKQAAEALVRMRKVRLQLRQLLGISPKTKATAKDRKRRNGLEHPKQ